MGREIEEREGRGARWELRVVIPEKSLPPNKFLHIYNL